MKAQPLQMIDGKFTQCLPKLATHLKIKRPSKMSTVILPVTITGIRKGTRNWSWNGDVDKPTLRPSILTRSDYGKKAYVCHSQVTDGMVQFLTDSTHSLAGTNCDLIDVDIDNN